MSVLICFSSLLFAQSDYNVRAADALNSSDWFTLRRVYDEGRDSMTPMLRAFSEAMIACNFATPDSACAAIDNLLKSHSNEIGENNVVNMNFLKSTQLAKKRDFGAAARVLSGALESSGASTSGYMNDVCRQYHLLDSVGNINEVAYIGRDMAIPFDLDTVMIREKPVYSIMLRARVNGKPMKVLFDTGAGVNIVSVNTAKELGFNHLDAQARSGGFGEVQGGYALAGSVELGDMSLRNVPFQVYDISTGVDSIDRYLAHLDMIIGVDFMNVAGELHIDFENRRLLVPVVESDPADGETMNLCGGTGGLFNIEAELNGALLPVSFDTGAANSTLCYSYFKRFRKQIEEGCESDTLRQAGVGGVKIEKAYKVKELDVVVNGVAGHFPEIMVSTESDALFSMYANLGMDYFMQFSKVIFNVRERFVRVVK